jgi:hypothetical protein
LLSTGLLGFRGSLEEVLGVIKMIIKSYGLKPGESEAIISLKTLDPALNISRKRGRRKPCLY